VGTAVNSTGLHRADLVRRGLRLEYLTIAYNSLEAVIAVISGLIAGSIALVSFGLDSVIEVTSGGALLWRLHQDANPAHRERNEAIALRIVGVCFLALAAYVAYESAELLIERRAPERSMPGILLAAASIIIMPLLARAKRQVAVRIDSAALAADARQTDICFYLSIILLVGLLLNATLGWWWADPVSGLAMVPIIAREGYNAVRGRSCGCGGTCHV
jgi:divalent metal cation (Fe/Co/Zn/Cd) transporter